MVYFMPRSESDGMSDEFGAVLYWKEFFSHASVENSYFLHGFLSIHLGATSYPTNSIILNPSNYSPRARLNSLGLPLRSNSYLSTLSFSRSYSTYTYILLETWTIAAIPISFVWAPGHKGISGNEGNRQSHQRRNSPINNSQIFKSLLPSNTDLFYHIKKFIKQHWFGL